MVSAGLLIYYGVISTTIEVEQPISVIGNGPYTIENAMAGETVQRPNDIIISNSADYDIVVELSEYPNYYSGIDSIFMIWSCSEVYGYPELCSGMPQPLGEITIPAEDSVKLSVSYELDKLLATGDYTVTTRIEPVA